MLFKEFMLTFLILAQQVQDAANSIYLKWIVLLWGTGQLRRLMQKRAGNLAPWHQTGIHGLPKGLKRQWQEEQAPCLEEAEHWLHGDVQLHLKGKSRLSTLQKTRWFSQTQWICEKGTQEPRRGPSCQTWYFWGALSGWMAEGSKSPWDGVPMSREPKLCRDSQVSGTLAELAREVCTARYSEDKESTSASSTFMSLHKQRHTHYN